MSKNLLSEYTFFKGQPNNIKKLLLTNMLYAMILPIIEIFVGAYIMRNTNNSSYVVIYQLFMYIGVVVTAVFNGFLLKKIKSSFLYGFGIIISTVVLVVMMLFESSTIVELAIAGLVLGAATGFFWTNRYLLTLNATNDDNRNYFFGLESFFFSLWNIVIPLIVGGVLVYIQQKELFGHVLNINNGYQLIAVVSFIIGVLACIVLSKGDFENPIEKKFIYFKFHVLWNKLLALAGLKGMVQGFLVTAPAILVMRLVGNEGDLGLIQGVGDRKSVV